MHPNLEVEGAYWFHPIRLYFFFFFLINPLITKLFPFSTSVCPSVHYAFLRTQYLRNHLRYEVDIWYTISRPYEDVLFNFWAECTKYCQSYFPFYEN